MHRWLPLVMIFGLAAGFRILGGMFPETLPNFQPISALFFCGAFLLPGWRGFAIPAAVWALTYIVPMIVQGYNPLHGAAVFVTTLLAFVAVFFLGRFLARSSAPTLLAGSLAGAVLFHLLTNGAAWLGSPLYPNTLAGLWQSLWTGPAGSPVPNWVFLRNLAAANLLFTAIVLAARYRIPAVSPASAAGLAR